MTEKDIEKKVLNALENAAPDDFDDVLSRAGREKGCVIEMTNTKEKVKRRFGTWQKILVAACLVLAIIGGVGGVIWGQNSAVASIVSLDVNPSIELKVNRNSKVLSCRGLNADAAAILFDMNNGEDLKGVKLDVAVNAIVGALVRNGYFDSLSSAILVSVEDNDADRAARLQQEVVAAIDSLLAGESLNASVYSQNIGRTDNESEAHGSEISTGKAYLVREIIENNKTADPNAFELLSALSVEELMDLRKTGDSRIPIGKAAAEAAAREYAGVADSVRAEVDAELDDDPPCYEVEFKTTFGDYEYRVDAFTGAILSGISDVSTHDTGRTVTEDEALNAALKHMNTVYPESKQFNVLDQNVYLDAGDQKYEVTFFCGGYWFEYEIDAHTGEVLDWDHERAAEPENNGGSSGSAAVSDIGAEAVKAAAFADAGVKESDVTNLKVERDVEKNGRVKYEIEFYVGQVEYDYEIDGAAGAIIDCKREDHAASSEDIGTEKAKAIALSHAGIDEKQVTGLRVERDVEKNGRVKYEIEFYVGQVEYDYEIDGATGDIIKSEKDPHGAVTPETTPPTPDTTAPKPETTVPTPETTVPTPETTAPTPETTAPKPETTAPTPETTAPTPETNPPQQGTKDIGRDEAKRIALAHANVSEKDVTNFKIEPDYDDGRLEYEIEFFVGRAEYDYVIDGETGRIIKYEIDDDEVTGNANSGEAGDIGREKAKTAAFAHAGVSEADVTHLKVEREEERGRIEYEIEFKVGNVEYEYKIDGATGAILEHERDIDD